MKDSRPRPRLVPSELDSATRNDRRSLVGVGDQLRRVLPDDPQQLGRPGSAAVRDRGLHPHGLGRGPQLPDQPVDPGGGPALARRVDVHVAGDPAGPQVGDDGQRADRVRDPDRARGGSRTRPARWPPRPAAAPARPTPGGSAPGSRRCRAGDRAAGWCAAATRRTGPRSRPPRGPCPAACRRRPPPGSPRCSFCMTASVSTWLQDRWCSATFFSLRRSTAVGCWPATGGISLEIVNSASKPCSRATSRYDSSWAVASWCGPVLTSTSAVPPSSTVRDASRTLAATSGRRRVMAKDDRGRAGGGGG